MDVLFFGPVAVLDASGGTVSRLATEFHVQWPLLIAQGLNFLLMALLLYRFALGPLLRLLDERRRTISDGLANAAEAERRLAASDRQGEEKLRLAAEEAQLLLAEARNELELQLREKRQRAELELATLRERERERIEEEQASALRSARKKLREEAAALAMRILRGAVDEPTAAQLTAAAARAIEKD
jgi:F-type H+-transporting ATPase subunit b